MNRSFRITALAIVAGMMLLASARPAFAADPTAEPTLSASPVGPQLALGVGAQDLILNSDHASGSFVIGNAGDVDAVVSVSTYDLLVDANGKTVPAVDPVPLGAAAWITIDKPSFTLAPSASEKVTFTVAIPNGASPGDHIAGIQVLGKMTDAAFGQVPQPSAGAAVRSQVSFPQTVIIRVPGEVKNDLSAAGAGAGAAVPGFESVFGGDYTFHPTVANNGNVAAVWRPQSGTISSLDDLVTVIPTLRLTSKISLLAGDALLFQGSTDDMGGIHISPITVLPGETKTLEMVLKDPPLLGMYDFTFTLPGSEADGRETVTATGTTTIVNTQKVLLWIVLPIVVILLLIIAFFVWRRLRKSRARRAEQRKQEEIARAREEGRREALAQQPAATPAQPQMTDDELRAAVAAEEARQSGQGDSIGS